MRRIKALVWASLAEVTTLWSIADPLALQPAAFRP